MEKTIRHIEQEKRVILKSILVYSKDSEFSNQVICTLENGTVFKGESRHPNDVICVIDKDRIYRNSTKLETDLIFKVRDWKIFKSNSLDIKDIEFTISEGIIYKGYTSEVIATIKNGLVYSGSFNFTGNILFRISEDVTLTEFVAIWFSFINTGKMLKELL